MTWKVCHTCWQQTFPRNLRPANMPPSLPLFLPALPACLSADSKARHVLQPRELRLQPGLKNIAYIVFFISLLPLHFPLWTEITRLSAAHLLCVSREKGREGLSIKKGFFHFSNMPRVVFVVNFADRVSGSWTIEMRAYDMETDMAKMGKIDCWAKPYGRYQARKIL